MGTEYFRHHPWIGLLSNLPVLLGVIALLLPGWSAFRRRLEAHPALLLTLLFVATRILFLALVAGFFRHVSLDLTTYFEAQGSGILAGKLPYRDFACSYSPLFPLLMALPAATPWPTVAIFLFFIACDLVAMMALRAAAARDGSPFAARVAWLYAAAPVTWYFLVRYGQDEALASAFLALAFLARCRRRDEAGSLLLGLGFCATKFTFGLAFIPFWLTAERRGRALLATLLPIVAVFGAAAMMGLPILAPLSGESVELGIGPSLWRLPVLLTPLRLGSWAGLILGAALVILWWRNDRAKPTLPLETRLVLTAIVFLLLSPKVLPMYITPFWPFVALWLARHDDRRTLGIAALLNLLLGTWWYVDAGGTQGMFGPGVQLLAYTVTAAIPVVLLLLARSVRRAP